MTTRPYELLARFSPNGSVAGVSVRSITNVNGRDYENDPQPLSGATDPAFIAFAASFSAAVVAQRDQLVIDKASLESQLATAQAELATTNSALESTREGLSETIAERDQRIIELEGQLEALLHPVANPRHLAPFDFLALLKPEEIFALQTSVDPVVVVGRAKLQTIITFVDLDNQETISLVRYMESIGMCEAGRADQILAGEPWQ